jgi:hypothetical protein
MLGTANAGVTFDWKMGVDLMTGVWRSRGARVAAARSARTAAVRYILGLSRSLGHLLRIRAVANETTELGMAVARNEMDRIAASLFRTTQKQNRSSTPNDLHTCL